MKTFEELGVSEPIRRAISELGFEQPMPVQEQVIPYLLGRLPKTHEESETPEDLAFSESDLIALAQTGTGKTAAFGIPLLQHIETLPREEGQEGAPQALILSPTRIAPCAKPPKETK